MSREPVSLRHREHWTRAMSTALRVNDDYLDTVCLQLVRYNITARIWLTYTQEKMSSDSFLKLNHVFLGYDPILR